MNHRRSIVALAVLMAAAPACRRDQPAAGEAGRKEVLGKVQAGSEFAEIYIAYGADTAILGLAVSGGSQPERYFPLHAATEPRMPPVVLDVFLSKSGEELWVRSSWPGSETLAYHRVGSGRALTPFGDVEGTQQLIPPYLSGGPLPFPDMDLDAVEKKATFRHQ